MRLIPLKPLLCKDNIWTRRKETTQHHLPNLFNSPVHQEPLFLNAMLCKTTNRTNQSPTRAVQGFAISAQKNYRMPPIHFDRDGNQNDPFKNIMLSSRLATGGAVAFAKCCKSLHSEQTPAGCKSPAAARTGRVLCAKFLLQNFYDPNCAGGCGVAPFPSWIRFRLPAVAYAVGRC